MVVHGSMFCMLLFISVGYIFLLLCLCFLIVIHVLFCTLTEVFPYFFLICKANARVYLAKTGHGPHSSLIALFHVLIVLFYVFVCVDCVVHVLFVCKCVLYYCHRVATQLQLTNISIFFFDFFPFEDRTYRLSRNVGSYLPNYVA